MKNNNTKIEVGFDVDPDKVGKKIGDISVHHMDDLEEVITEQQIEVAILTIPAQQAQQVTDRLVKCQY